MEYSETFILLILVGTIQHSSRLSDAWCYNDDISNEPTPSEYKVPAPKSAIAAAFMDWRQCAMSQMEKIGSEPKKNTEFFGAGPVTVPNSELFEKVEKMVRQNLIDYIIIDNEGPEYDVIPMIAVHELFAENDIVFCQINVEFHEQGPEERKAKFSKIMLDLLQVGRYAVIRHQKHEYQLMFLVDFKNSQCVEKYLKQFLTDD
ncbi:hypothetical protein KIN20_024307 [Parelaphostrongylus tenuis]|uniref:Methyltransferase FkbM domain-containing protein n=1 Tax=Parelaphostrongylus tenuis TaxID=148309 RepID=A0AAD5QWN6_PARTN|nr:hypothetical protein KIN20_024307 [Parelaphostrongylus tenuis]